MAEKGNMVDTVVDLADAQLALRILEDFKAGGGFSTGGTINVVNGETDADDRNVNANDSGSPEESSKVEQDSKRTSTPPQPDENNDINSSSGFGGGDKTTAGGWHVVRSVAICGVVILVVYAILAYIIFHENKAAGNSIKDNAIGGVDDHQGLEVCGADSFMLNDGVCDETTNNELCHWDGGDCCRDRGKKSESFCKDCQCRLTPLEEQEALFRFHATQSRRLWNVSTNFVTTREEKNVPDVVTVDVCIVLCTDPELEELVNAWKYDYDSQLCSCAWLTPTICDFEAITEDQVVLPDQNSTDVIAYIHLTKTISCSCQKLGAKFIPQENEFEFEEDSQVISNWHCQKRCSLADHCTTYNWNMAGENECVLINGVEGENKLMEAESWVAGVSDCSSLYAFTYQAICPPNGLYFGRVSDGVCDDGTNIKECGYDGGDCCDPRSSIESCSKCQCIECLPGQPCIGEGLSADPDQGTCPSGGDFVCNSFNNREHCNFDDGDCCLYNANCGEDCRDNPGICACHESNVLYCPIEHIWEPTSHCKDWDDEVGNDFCEDYNNNPDCGFDGGDCCKPVEFSDLSFYHQYCTLCQCKFCLPGMICIGYDYNDGSTSLCPRYTIDNELSDGYCDDHANVEECAYDNGDCCHPHDWYYGYCTECLCKHCIPGLPCSGECPLKGDGMCDGDHNIIECDFDGGDCCLEGSNCLKCNAAGPHDSSCSCHVNGESMCSSVYSDCPTGLPHDLIWDNVCQDELNVAECLYDGGDCCAPDSNKDDCRVCACLKDCPSHLPTELIKDSVCHDNLNFEECLYDGGDCCHPNASMSSCTKCVCKQCEPDSPCKGECPPFVVFVDQSDHNLGDGTCDEYFNYPECNYDAGDCTVTECPALLLMFANDGYCDDFNNDEACGYDGGDCCLSEVNTDYCDLCDCHLEDQ